MQRLKGGKEEWSVLTTARHNNNDHPPTTNASCADVWLHTRGGRGENVGQKAAVCVMQMQVLRLCMRVKHANHLACTTSMHMPAQAPPELPLPSAPLQPLLRPPSGRWRLAGPKRGSRRLHGTHRGHEGHTRMGEGRGGGMTLCSAPLLLQWSLAAAVTAGSGVRLVRCEPNR